jgi:hypothetical protein
MSAAAPINPSAKASPLEVFRERAEARSLLVANGFMPLQDALDGLQEAAAAQGLLKRYGQTEIQEILVESFARWHVLAEIAELERLAELRQQQEIAEILERISAPIDEPRRDNPRRDAGPPPYRTATSTVDAFWHVVGLRDQGRFKAWLADHPRDAPFLLQLLKGK